MSVAMKAAIDDAVTDELREIIGDEHRVLPNISSRVNRTRTPAPFPVHRWAEFMPDVAVLPTSAEQVSGVLKLANRLRIPVVPRAGGTGLADGAVPLRGGILVDVKLMNQIKEIDLTDRTVTVGTGINMLKLNEELRPHGVFYPDDPASYPCSIVGGRIGTGGWSLLGGRFGHTRDLVVSMEFVLPSGEIIEVGDGGGRKLRKSSTGFMLKQLFMGHQGTLGIATEATLELVNRPEAQFSAFFAFDDYMKAYRTTGRLARSGVATLAGVVLFDEWKLRYLRRDDEAYIEQPEDVKAVVAVAMYGKKIEVEPASKLMMELGRSEGGRYLGDEISTGDWDSRHERYATPLHGRRKDGQVVPMCWHCEDAAIPYSALPKVRDEWHALVAKYVERWDIFDDWGMFAYTNGSFKPWGDYLVEIDVGIWEQELNDENWAAWVKLKREIAEVSIKHGGSITACHGATREGDAELVPTEMGSAWPVVKAIKRTLDPNNIMNPGKYLLDQAYGDGGG
jgi:glycolate dehydrogenase FAD-linked subunit